MPPVKMKGTAKPKNAGKTILRLLGYMGAFKALWPLVVVCVLVSSLSRVAGTYLLKPAINDFIIPLIGKQNPDLGGFARLIALIAAIYVCGALATWANSRLMLCISAGTLYKIRTDLFAKMETLPLRFYDTHTHGELMSRFTNDTDTLRDMLSQSVPQMLTSAVSLAGVLTMMLVLSPILAGIMIVTVFGTTGIAAFVGKRSVSSFRQNQNAVGEINGYIEELMTGQKVVKVFNHEEEAQEQFDTLNEALRSAGTAANTYANILGPIMNNYSHIQYALIASAGSMLAVAGIIDIGTIVPFLQYTRQFSQPISQLSQLMNVMLNALAGAERIFSIIDMRPESDEGAVRLNRGQIQGEIIFDKVNFGYTETKQILHGIDIHAKPGQKIALVGSTGSGKTTVTNLLTRFYDLAADGGTITYDGIPLQTIRKDDLRLSLGMVLQDTHLFTGSIADNIRYGKLDATDEEVRAAARLANADGFIRHLPQGYDTVIVGDGGNLSQGQRQLIAIARAAVANPPVLILDEATSSIDTRTEAMIQKGMDSLMRGRTTFVIAHRLSTVRNADEIIVLEQGRIIERGNHDSLIAAKGKYYKLYTGAFAEG